MMKGRTRWAAVAFLGAVAVAVVAAVGSASAGGRVLHLHIQGGSSTFVNVAGKNAPAVGDEVILKQPVWRNGRRVGTGIVTIVLTGGQTDQLHASLALRGGEIDAGGVQLTNGDRFTLPITGGTGTYEGASGQVRVHTLQGKGNPTDVTIELE
jgi:Allene oxide cyclase barrel like domain